MTDSDLIDVESLEFSDDQTWLYQVPDDSGEILDIVDWGLSIDWPVYDDDEYAQTEKELYSMLDEILKSQVSLPDKHKFDSRTFVRPKKRMTRPSIQSIVETPSPNNSLTPQQSADKYLTYNKYNAPSGILRLKTFNVDTNTDNSNVVKEFAMKRRSLVQEDDPQLEDDGLPSAVSERLAERTPTKPIHIDLSQPAHNLHNTFNKGLTNIMNERGSLNMYQSGESLMRMSPPSLVSSLLMETSGNFNLESLDSRRSVTSHRDSGIPPSARDSISARESIDPMMTSMTLSILDDKDMNTSFLSQTTYPDNDSLIDSMPPSLVSSVNSSYIVTSSSKPKDSVDSNNVFSSATFTHLEQSERLLSARPRCQLYNSFTKRDSIRNSESYTKSREEACQMDATKILNENSDNKDSPKNNEMGETVVHYTNYKFKNAEAEKENCVNSSFEKDDAFYKEMGIQRKTVDLEKNSINVTLDKQELNEIIQARQKLSLARKALPTEPERSLPNQVEVKPSNQIVTLNVPKKSIENASELLARRRFANGYDRPEDYTRDVPKRNATFKKPSPKADAMDATVVYVNADDRNIIDINSATLTLVDCGETTLQQEEWGSQERAMAGSGSSTDTGTFSSSSPPDCAPAAPPRSSPRSRVASTPVMSLKKTAQTDLLNLHNTISPIYDIVDDKSYTVAKAPSFDNPCAINSATLVKKTSAKRDILAGRVSPEKRVLGPSIHQKNPPGRVPATASYGSMAPPQGLLRKTNLPSKLRQYSSQKDLSQPTGNAGSAPSLPRAVAAAGAARSMLRRGVYASNPALSPTAPAPARDLYARPPQLHYQRDEDSERPKFTAPPLVRQGTETLRRERPQSQLVQPKDLRTGANGAPVSMRTHQVPPPTTRPSSIAATSQLRVSRPASGPVYKPVPAPPPAADPTRPAHSADARVSALPRPSRLPAPAPRRSLRPPSVYSVAPTADMDHY